jgi:7,8-dihydropterin-6-yl-methyl-4-(beta-D-ribofuranosyl)aminobenzene 5'-phosphate synthase
MLMAKNIQTAKIKLKPTDEVEIISLVDNSIDILSTPSNPQVQPFWQWVKPQPKQNSHSKLPLAEHGFSMLVRLFNGETRETFLFDTGGSANTIKENAKIMGLNLGEIGFVVLSHGHYDHFGGLLSVIDAVEKKTLPIFVHEDMFKSRGTASRIGTIREYPKFPNQTKLESAKLILTKKPHLVANEHVCITGEIPRKTSFEKGLANQRTLVDGVWQPDPLIVDDRAVVINIKDKGLLVLSGCAHAGIINTINYAIEITGISTVYAVFGGFHLAGRGFEDRIESTIAELIRVKPSLVAPSHCTGWRAILAISQAFPDSFVWNSVGNLYRL